MVQNDSTQSLIFSSGYDIWIFSRRNIHLKNQITWALNLQPLALDRASLPFDKKQFERLGQALNFEMKELSFSAPEDAPLLIESSHLLPVPRVAIVNDKDWSKFKDSLLHILSQFNVAKARVFLPPDSKENELTALKKHDAIKYIEIQWVFNESNI